MQKSIRKAPTMAKKKDFTNPMGFFFSQESIDQAEKTEQPIKEEKPSSKRTTKKRTAPPAQDDLPKREKKSQRVQILLKPTLYAELRQRAYEEDLSVNEAISRAIKAYLKERK